MHQLDTLFKDRFTLIVHHAVEFQQVFTNVEIPRFDFLLCLFECLVDPWVDDGFTFFQAQALEDAIHPVCAKNAHQIIIKAQIEF